MDPGTYVRHNELWRVETNEATAVTSERFLVANEALLTYEPFLPAAGESSAYAELVQHAHQADWPDA